MLEEFQALMTNNTWSLVPKTTGANIVTGKWIFDTSFTVMAPWLIIKHVGLFVAALNKSVSTMEKLLVRCLNWALFGAS